MGASEFMMGLNSVEKIRDVLAYINDSKSALDQAELKLKILEVTNELSSVQAALQTADEHNLSLYKQIDELTEALKRKADMTQHHGYYYEKGEDGKPVGAAFCPSCLQERGYLYNLVRLKSENRCPSCKADYGSRVSIFAYPE